MTRRTSTRSVPTSSANLRACSTASASESTSRIAKPAISSLASANGPSITRTVPSVTSTRAPCELERDALAGQQDSGHRRLLHVLADRGLLLGRRQDAVLHVLGLVVHHHVAHGRLLVAVVGPFWRCVIARALVGRPAVSAGA